MFSKKFYLFCALITISTFFPLSHCWPSEVILDEFKTYLKIPYAKRSWSFSKDTPEDCLTLIDSTLTIRSPDPTSYLETLGDADLKVPILKTRFSMVENLDPTLLPISLESLMLMECDMDVDDTFIEGVGEALPSLTSLTITGKRYYPMYRRHLDYASNPPLRPSFTSLSSLKELCTLRLENMKFPYLPEDICQLTHLKYLSLSHNYDLEYLPEKLTQLSCLRVLNISKTRIHDIPDWISQMPALEELYLGYMDDLIAGVPEEWCTPRFDAFDNHIGVSLPMDKILNMEGLIIYMSKCEAEPYLENASKKGLTRTHEPNTYVVMPRKDQGRLTYIWKSYGLPGIFPRKITPP